MKALALFLLLSFMLLVTTACGGGATPAQSPTAGPTAAVGPTSTAAPTTAAGQTPTATPTTAAGPTSTVTTTGIPVILSMLELDTAEVTLTPGDGHAFAVEALDQFGNPIPGLT